MHKIITANEAAKKIESGMTIMIGGFLGVGAPDVLIEEIINNKVTDLTIICNDTSFPDQNIGKLVVNGMVKKVYTSHIGTNPE